MNVNWLVEHDIFEEDLGPLIGEIKRQGMKVEQIKYVPFESGTYENFADDECVLCYGSLNLIRQLRRQKPWIPGSFCDLPNFECSKYYAYYGGYLFNHEYTMLPLSELNRRAWKFFNYLWPHPGDPQFFVRLSSGFKTFTGQVVKKSTFEKDFSWFEEFASPDSLVVVAPCARIHSEYRLVIANRKVIAASRYKESGKLNVQEGAPTRVLDFAHRITNEVEWEPDPIYVMDIATGNSSLNGIGLLELNSMSCSGFYACPVEPIVTVASELAQKEWEDINGEMAAI